MTRINITYNLSDELLVNALGEEPRVLQGVLKRIQSGKSFDDVPDSFTLNKGHVTFFYDKCLYIFDRYLRLRIEYLERFGKSYSKRHLANVVGRLYEIKASHPELLNDWIPDDDSARLVKLRILERSKGYKRPHHYKGEVITDWKTFLEL